MAFSEFLADRVRTHLHQNNANITDEKRMFGGLVFMVNDNMCVGISRDKETSANRIMVRVGKASHEKLVFTHGSQEMNFTGRVMRGFLFIPEENIAADSDLDFWVQKALEFNREIA